MSDGKREKAEAELRDLADQWRVADKAYNDHHGQAFDVVPRVWAAKT